MNSLYRSIWGYRKPIRRIGRNHRYSSDPCTPVRILVTVADVSVSSVEPSYTPANATEEGPVVVSTNGDVCKLATNDASSVKPKHQRMHPTSRHKRSAHTHILIQIEESFVLFVGGIEVWTDSGKIFKTIVRDLFVHLQQFFYFSIRVFLGILVCFVKRSFVFPRLQDGDSFCFVP
jgi:hypothetical protein